MVTQQDDVIPPTEPVATIDAPRKAKGKTGKRSTILSGSSLTPNIDATRDVSIRQHWYWIGTLPTAPVDNIQIKGVNFPKAEEIVTQRNGKTHRHGVIGALVQLDEAAIKRLRERLPRTVIRVFPEGKGAKEDAAGTGMTVGDAFSRLSKGRMITIPRKEDLELLRKQGLPTHEYVQHPNDQPGSRYMFAVLCEDQDRPTRGSVYPDVLEITGIEWPEELRE